MNADERERHVLKLFPVVFKIAHRVARICRVPDEDDLVGDGSLDSFVHWIPTTPVVGFRSTAMRDT